jgi:pre-rRNA-processing protein TSR3
LTKLTTAEALAAALCIVGHWDQAEELLSIFKWGHTFLEMNDERLKAYAMAKDSAEVVALQNSLIQRETLERNRVSTMDEDS